MIRTRGYRLLVVMVALVATLCVTVGASPASAKRPPKTTHRLLPIVFVHGQSGSAQQFESQAMRFTSNGYPQELLYAFEYNTNEATNPIAALDVFIDHVLAKTHASQVYAIGHSRGTSVWTTYLDPVAGIPGGSAKVAKYVNIDGRTMEGLPGGVPTIGVWGEWNTAGSGYNRRGDTNAQIGPDPADNYYFGGKSHTETATSADTFAVMYRFLVGRAPRTTDVVPEPPGQVEVSGRAVLFPENLGYAGSTVQVWRIDDRTGRRIGPRPRATFAIDESGDFGPVRVNSRQRYEFTIVRPGGAEEHHTYTEPFLHSDHFLRLNTSLPDGPLDAITPDSDTTTNLVIVRMREWWAGQGTNSDQLSIDGLNVMQPNISPRTGVNLAVFVQDDGLDGITDLAKGELPPFGFVAFLTAADVYIPASSEGSGPVRVTETPRGGGEPATVNVPNWPSSTNAITIQFRDYELPRKAHHPHRR